MAAGSTTLVEITPEKEILFLGPDHEKLYSTITLDNVTSVSVAYKVKITVPDKLSAEPPKGIIGVGQQITVNITLQKGQIPKLALLVQTVPVSPENSKKTVDSLMKDMASEITNTLIKVRRETSDSESIFYSCVSTFPDDEDSPNKKKWWK